jgi:glucokinase
MPSVVAIDLGGTSTRAGFYANAEPPAQAQRKLPTPSKLGPDAVLERIVQAIEAVLPPEAHPDRIGVGAPGPLDPYRGVVLDAPNVAGMVDMPLRDRISERFGCPVALGNDANLAALGELRYGAGRGAKNLLYLNIGTGIGGGVIADGHLLLGKRGLAAELGHMQVQTSGERCGCGQVGHLEAIANGPAIARAARQRLLSGEPSSLIRLPGSPDSVTTNDIGRAALQGDPLARSVLEEAGRAIGLHLASLVHAFDPEVIVLGGGVSLIGPLFFEPIERAMRMHVMHPAYLDGLRLVASELGDEAGLIGAMILAREL